MKFFCCWAGVLAILVSGCGKAQDESKNAINLQALRVTVVKRLQAQELQEDVAGVVTLPQDLASASLGGRVFVGRRPSLNVVFVSKVTDGNMTNGFIYSETPINRSTLAIRVGAVDWSLSVPLDEHWRMVSAR